MSVRGRESRIPRFDPQFLERALFQWQLTPVHISVVYLVFGVSALYFSDVYLVQRFSDPLLSQLQALKGGIEVLLTGLLIFGLTWLQKAQLERSHDKIKRQHEELHVLHRVMRHNLRNDLNVILGTSELLSSRNIDPEANRYCNRIAKAATKMVKYTKQAARIRRVAQNGRVVTKDLTEELPSIIEEQVQSADHVDIEVDLPESAVVKVNHMFREAIEEVIENAIEHNDHENPRITITVDPSNGPLRMVDVRISDNGPGIPGSVVTVLNQSESDQLSHLEGMGLWFVTWVVSSCGGDLIIDDSELGGAQVSLCVPAAKRGSMNYLTSWITQRIRMYPS